MKVFTVFIFLSLTTSLFGQDTLPRWSPPKIETLDKIDSSEIERIWIDCPELNFMLYETDDDWFMVKEDRDKWKRWKVTGYTDYSAGTGFSPFHYYDTDIDKFELIQVNGRGKPELVLESTLDMGGTMMLAEWKSKSVWDIEKMVMIASITFKAGSGHHISYSDHETLVYVDAQGDTMYENDSMHEHETWDCKYSIDKKTIELSNFNYNYDYYRDWVDDDFHYAFESKESDTIIEDTHVNPPTMGVYKFKRGYFILSEKK